LDILEKIVRDKRIEVASKKAAMPLSYLVTSPLMEREVYSLSTSVVSGSGIIAEYKRRSPSRQMINQKDSVVEVVSDYQMAGVSGVSVLTDTKYFGGSLDDLIQARAHLKIPLLRKEFIIDPYQIYESRAYGADAILLIAAVLEREELMVLAQLAHQLGLEVLLELHSEEELKRSDLDHVDLVGVNNRNLKTFEVSLSSSKLLAPLIPDDKVKISESGISSINAIRELKQFGYKGFLIGENFMRSDNPGGSAVEFINALDDAS
jgi:indole-3-glycerol phosphate synthase